MTTTFELLTGDIGEKTGSLINPGSNSFKTPAHSIATTEIDILFLSQSYETSSLASSLGAMVYMLTSSFIVESFGISTSQGITGSAFSENHDYINVTSDSYPGVLQGINSVTWNPFPEPAVVVPDTSILSQRDLSRFKKAYSFSRPQPRRIRIYRSR